MGFSVLIPARLASTRLPGKPLADIGGQPMIVRVAQRAVASSAERVVVAADSPEIVAACQARGVEAILTRGDHATGSDRLAQACDLLNLGSDELVVNVQGDEPLIEPHLIDAVAAALEARPEASMSTAAHRIDSPAEFNDPNVVKVVVDARGLALYFSRAPIPWWRDGLAAGIQSLPEPAPLRHIGFYAYRAGFLRQFGNLREGGVEAIDFEFHLAVANDAAGRRGNLLRWGRLLWCRCGSRRYRLGHHRDPLRLILKVECWAVG
jgi:3-deoxy-manno-octulosonate cytidylyltransferase (CMP-KDO synthetase)